eukprot:8388048-Pyramimonas_sp.AAC.1
MESDLRSKLGDVAHHAPAPRTGRGPHGQLDGKASTPHHPEAARPARSSRPLEVTLDLLNS